MDWEEDDIESMEDYYISDNAVDDIDFDDDGGDGEDDDDDDILANREQKNYTVLKEEDIRRRQEDDIAEISAVLSVPRVAACMLLRQYKWSVNSVHEAWFADEDRVRKEVGLVEKGSFKYQDAKKLKCGICFEIYSPDEMTSAACGHPYCCACWTTYISISINDGPGCLTLRCPEPSCGAAVNQDMVDVLVCNEDKDKYQRYLLRSYVENNRTTKWCPSPGCDCAVEFDIGSGIQDVSCLCSYIFCWNCIEEAHRPVDCNTVAKWIMRNTAESENTDWIIANSKPCPKCKRPIEKNQGCMHMTCTQPCKFEFCWLCLGAWSDHGKKTGGFYACNRYEAAKQEGAYDESERKRERAKKSLEKYTHYYERWATNDKSRQKALADLHQMRTVHLDKLREDQHTTESELDFVIEAWLQIVECRRVLKWTYAYGFYLAENEFAKRQFFEYLQGEAEANLERLHQCAEKELQNHYGDDHGTSEDFINFRTKLAHLTRVTHNYFDNLVRELENGLADVDSAGTSTNTTNSKADPQRSKGKNKKGKEQLTKAHSTSSDN